MQGRPGCRGTAKCRHVIDVDSLCLEGVEPQIRLWGVDAPELDEPSGSAARVQLVELAQGKTLNCRRIDIDKYGRIAARCFDKQGLEINRAMIEGKIAKEYTRFTKGYYSRKN